jgi:hypothetical protein
MNRPDERAGSLFDRFFRTMMSIPSEVYFFATVASIVGSALLYSSGRRHSALFVGEWAPTLLTAALFYKLLRPSGQRVTERVGETVAEMAR